MELVECTLDRINDLESVAKTTFKETFGEQNSEEDMCKYLAEAYAKDVLVNEIEDPDSKTYLAYSDGKVVGYLKINKGAAQSEKGYTNSLEIQRIYVLKEAKGQGIGSAFLALAESKAKEWQLAYIWLGVWEHNEKAKAFYKAKGFVKFSEHTFVLGNDRQTDYLLKKEL